MDNKKKDQHGNWQTSKTLESWDAAHSLNADIVICENKLKAWYDI